MTSAELERAVVDLEGDRLRLPPDDPGLDPVTREITMHCSTSGTIEGSWTGVPVADALRTAVPASTTHLLVTCRDGYRVRVAVADAVDALFAYRRDGEPLVPDGVRLVGESIDSTESARGVTAIEAMSLDPSTDPMDLERVEP